MKKILVAVGAIIVVAGLFLGFGPTEPVDETISFKAETLGTDLEAYLSESEAKIPGIQSGAQKEIIWADPAQRNKTPFSIVYLHGFSATKEEVRPLPDLVAAQLGANLYYARLSGHGRDGEAMAEPTVNDWFNDTAEALAIGRVLGEKVVVLSGSTGGTFSTWAAAKPELMENVAGMVMISPNYGLNNPASPILTYGGARAWVPLLIGAERTFKPANDEHAKWWTTSYPTVAVLPMAASVEHVNTLSFEDISVPALFIFHPEDTVVRPDITKSIAERWGQNTGVSGDIFEVTQSEDKDNHVIAGRIMSPSNSEPLAQQAVTWIKNLK